MLCINVVLFAFFTSNILLVSTSQQQQQQTRGLIPPELLVDSNLYHLVPQGVILLWSGPAHLVPRGWAVCDGTQGTPDLRDRFVIGSGPNAQFSVGHRGGASSVTPTVAVRPTRLTVAQMPEHSHRIATFSEDADAICYTQHSYDETIINHKNKTANTEQLDKSTLAKTCQYRQIVEKQGNSESHSHEVTVDSLNITPSFHALIYIMKL